MENSEIKKYYIKKALELAEFGMKNSKGGPFGAVIVKNGNIIGEGFNSVTSSNDPSAHAEINAIRNACKHIKSFDLAGCTIYTSCEPCPMCLAAIYWANIDEIYYAATKEQAKRAGFRDEFIYSEINKPIEQREKHFEQIIDEKVLKIFDEWILSQNKMPY